MNENSSFRSQLDSAVASKNLSSLEMLANSVGDMVLEDGALAEEHFQSILATLQDDRFASLEGSWKLIRVFEENWSELSARQRDMLLPVLESTYASFTDWMACFVISGILGELYSDERAFEVLRRLRRTQKEMPRAFVPHGFEHIAANQSNGELAGRALVELTDMERDQSEMVRGEVSESFKRLRNRALKSNRTSH